MLNGAIAYLRVKGFQEIKAPLADFDTPQVVYSEFDKQGFAPDLIARKDFGVYLFQVVEDPNAKDLEEQRERWEIFEQYAKRKRGRFYLITYSDCADDLTTRLKDSEVEAGLIKIRK